MKRLYLFLFLINLLFIPLTYKTYANENYMEKIINEIENQIIVKFKSEIKNDRTLLQVSPIDINKNQYKKISSDTYLVDLNEYSNPEDIIQEYKNNASVDFVEKNKLLNLFDIVNDTHYPSQWELEAINATQAWNYFIYAKKTPIVVAVIDTGINTSHPDLIGKIAEGGKDFAETGSIEDEHGHGTAVAGIIAANTNNGIGVAGVCGYFDVKVLPLKVVKIVDGKPLISLDKVLEALEYAIQKNVDIINISLGNPEYNRLENYKIQKVISKGITVVAAGGNDKDDRLNYPASYDNVISVGSIDENKSRSDFSNFNDKIDYVAPGRSVQTCKLDGGYGEQSGTSFSSPIVAGLIANLKSLSPDISLSEINQVLQATTIDLGASGKDNYYGYGLIQNHEAILELLDSIIEPEKVGSLNNDFIVQYPIYEFIEGNENISINSADNITIKTTIANYSDFSNTITVFSAIYNNNNYLLDVKIKTIEFQANETKNYIQEINLYDLEEVHELKTFIFYDISDKSPTPIIKPIICLN